MCGSSGYSEAWVGDSSGDFRNGGDGCNNRRFFVVSMVAEALLGGSEA